MEWTVPIHTFEVSKTNLSTVIKSHKPMATISYTDGELHFPSLSLLLPHLPIKSYDSETGKLSLSLQGSQAILNKLTALQNLILQSTYANYHAWFPLDKPRHYEDIVASFQPIISHGCIHLYCPLSTAGSFNEINLFSGGVWSRGNISQAIFTPGKQIRIAIRLQGISFHQHPITRMWTGKSRIQHRILAIYAD